jgi:hypothetical protein
MRVIGVTYEDILVGKQYLEKKRSRLNGKAVIKLTLEKFEAPYYVTFFIILFIVINEVIILSLRVS